MARKRSWLLGLLAAIAAAALSYVTGVPGLNIP